MRILANQKFGNLTALRTSGRSRSGNYLWKCRCECGKSCLVRGGDLVSGHTTSCGCCKGWPTDVPDYRDRKGERNGMTHLMPDDVHEIFRLRKAGWLQREIGEAFGIVQCTVSAILNGRNWKHITT